MHAVEDFLQELASTLQVIRIYTHTHPKSTQALDLLFGKLAAILDSNKEIVIGIVGNEFVLGKNIFFDLSARLKDFIEEFTSRGVEKIIFVRGITRDELAQFVTALTLRRDDAGSDFKEYFKALGLEKVLIDKIKVSESTLAAEGNEGGAAPAVTYIDALSQVSAPFKGLLRNEFVDFYHTRLTLKNMLTLVSQGNWQFLSLTDVKRHDLATFVHSLNVGILAMFVSSALGFKKEHVIDIGMAGLFHDMGKIAISRKVIQKPTFLDDQEMDAMKSHTLLGAEILLQHVETLGIMPVLVAFEHHLRYDLQGYPKLEYPRKPSTVSLIVTLCDCYDALRSRRSYKADYPPESIYAIMLKGKGTMFDPMLFDRFFECIGVYPAGTVVELDDGCIGVVRQVNKEDIFSPQLEILSPQEKKGLMLDLIKEKDIHIAHSLNPFTRDKEYKASS